MMKAKKTLQVVALSTLILAGCVSAAPAQNQLVSGEPHPGFFEGVAIPAHGPVLVDQLAMEAPGHRVTVEGRTISQDPLFVSEMAASNPEAFLGQIELEEDGELTILAIIYGPIMVT